MPKVIYVKRARKAQRKHGIKKGDSYYHWGTRVGGRFVKRISKTKPKPSQLTNSEFWKTFLQIGEEMGEAPGDVESYNESLGEIKEQLQELMDETQEKFDNMPESLQQGSTGQLLEERVGALDEAILQLDDLELKEYAPAETIADHWSKIEDVLSQVSCG